MFDLFRALLRGVNWIYSQLYFWLRKIWEWPMFLLSFFIILLQQALRWIADTIWSLFSSAFVGFLSNLGFETPSGFAVTELTGWFVDLFAFDVLGRMVVNYLLILVSARVVLYVCFVVKQLTRIIP